MNIPRTVAAELLDHLAPTDPAAMRSRRDLRRIHRVMGTRSILARTWWAMESLAQSGRPLHILELGAGDGRLLLGVARSVAPGWPPVALTLMDRLPIVDPATVAAYADVGWIARAEVADVLAWAARPHTAAARWDLVTTTLFLHHFDDRQLSLLLGAVAACADRFVACEPRRGWAALAGSHLVGAIGANAVTRQDAVASVHAGFRGRELSAHWPPGEAHWHTREFSAGLFCHCFCAHRTGAG